MEIFQWRLAAFTSYYYVILLHDVSDSERARGHARLRARLCLHARRLTRWRGGVALRRRTSQRERKRARVDRARAHGVQRGTRLLHMLAGQRSHMRGGQRSCAHARV